jgi:hypothetical protein
MVWFQSVEDMESIEQEGLMNNHFEEMSGMYGLAPFRALAVSAALVVSVSANGLGS